MRFYDEAEITVQAGSGGNGMVFFHREKYVPKGGPSGGDGGDGAHVYFRSTTSKNTLHDFVMKKRFEASSGGKGEKAKMAGARADDLILDVPIGTMVFDGDTGEKLFDCTEPGMLYLAARGGRGGLGNSHFATAVRQAPTFAELGEPGEKRRFRLELKLVADVGIIGVPSAGKSTLISVISAAKPKIADYPFTTLVPNLGVVPFRDETFVVADVPGLIEGAAEGKGLGHTFLRHVERTTVIVHLLDITRADVVADYEMIQKELGLFSKDILAKPQVVAINKIDAVDEETAQLVAEDFTARTGVTPLLLSAVARKGLDTLLERLWEPVKAHREAERAESVERAAAPRVYRPAERVDARRTEIVPEGNGFRLKGRRVEQVAVMTNMENPEGVARLYDILKKRGILRRLVRRGASEGTPIYIGNHTLEYQEE